MHVKKIVKFIKKDEGSGLILALMTLMVLSVLGASLGVITIGSYKLADVNREDTSAYYIAEAGANMAYEEMKKGVLGVDQEYDLEEDVFFDKVYSVTDEIVELINSNDNYYKFESQFDDTPKVKIEINVKSDSNPTIYLIESTGELAGKSRTVNKTVEVTWTKETEVDLVPETPVGAAVIANGDIFIKKNIKIKDDVIVNDIKNIKWSGNSTSTEEAIDGVVKTPILNWNDYEKIAESFPKKSELFKELTTNTINLDDSDNLFFQTSTLNLGDLKINGNGIVNIFVEDKLNFTGDKFNLENDFRNVRIFFAGDQMLIDRNYEFNASLFVEKADITINKRVSFNGVLLYGGNKEIKLDVKNDFLESYLIAPFAHVTFRNHVDFIGSIIAKSVDIDNQSTIKYKPIGDFPFSFKGTGTGEDVSSNDIITSEPGIEN